MKKNIPLILIFASSILIISNFIISEKIDRAFWLTTISGSFIILSMVLRIRKDKKQN